MPPITDLSVRIPAQYAWPADLEASTRPAPGLSTHSSPSQQSPPFNDSPSPTASQFPLSTLTPYPVSPSTWVPTLTHLEFRADNKKSIDVITVLPDLKEVAPGLGSLSLPLRKWDEEIMYPTTDFFPKLRKLKILYDEGHPSEVRCPFSH